jgi:predicted CXXCH cytochrome family protein
MVMSRFLIMHIFAILFSVGAMDRAYKGTPSGGQPGECVDCHIDQLEYKVMHMAAEDACDNCHESTGAAHPQDGVIGFNLMDRMPDLCFYCHEEPVYQEFGHPPVVKKECLSCHDAHGSSEPVLLQLPEQELCLSCHNRTYRTDSTETVNIRQLIIPNRMAHSAITDGGCIICHKSHGSEFPAMLNEKYPKEEYVPALTQNFELCFLCHDTDLIESEETEWGTNFRNGKRNLHQLHINGNKGRNCKLCHNLHGSSQMYLIEEKVGFGNWEMKMNFIPQEQGGSCLPGCHDRKSYTR